MIDEEGPGTLPFPEGVSNVCGAYEVGIVDKEVTMALAWSSEVFRSSNKLVDEFK